jgi:hypothetical protein
MLDPTFESAFRRGKQRIRATQYHHVEESDQNLQAFLEIYCAIVLSTPYNDFGTHSGECETSSDDFSLRCRNCKPYIWLRDMRR